MSYIALFFLLLLLELLYFKIADKFNIIDKPNSRSSHQSITLRGGGIIFPIAILISFFLGYISWPVTLAVVLVAVVSFVDDITPLSQFPRFATHLVAVGLIFYELDIYNQAIWIVPIVLVLLIGWINAFNFMDGINGITVLYALTAIGSFAFLPTNANNLSVLLTVGISCVVFGIFNLRTKAKTFAGDVGSISMALFLGFFMIKTIIETGQLGYLLFFCVYGIDAVLTIITRLRKKENIFQPHRSHLYQYLANERGFSHLSVAVMYAAIQLLLNVLIIYMDNSGYLNLFYVTILLVALAAIYLVIRNNITRQLEFKNV